MKKRVKLLKEVFLRDWTPGEKSFLLTDVLLFGLLLGWLTSPLRRRPATEQNMEEEEESEEEWESEEETNDNTEDEEDK